MTFRQILSEIRFPVFLHPVIPPSQQQHEAHRSWVSQEQKALVLGDLIQRSEAFQAERRKAEQDANRKRAAAAEQGMIGRAAAKTKAETMSLVPPQVEATQVKPQKRDHATESQRKASTALAQQVGVGRSVDGPSPHLHAGSLDYCYWRKLQ